MDIERRSSCLAGRRLLVPDGKGLDPVGVILGCAHAMSPGVAVLVNRTVGGQELLRLAD